MAALPFSADRELSQLAAGGMTRDAWDHFNVGLSGDALRAEPRLGPNLGLACGQSALRRAGFPACRFAGLSSPVFGTGDWKVARTGRQECLPCIRGRPWADRELSQLAAGGMARAAWDHLIACLSGNVLPIACGQSALRNQPPEASGRRSEVGGRKTVFSVRRSPLRPLISVPLSAFNFQLSTLNYLPSAFRPPLFLLPIHLPDVSLPPDRVGTIEASQPALPWVRSDGAIGCPRALRAPCSLSAFVGRMGRGPG
jgi:hypothetical protein